MRDTDGADTYYCICHWCHEETTAEGYDAANEFFSDHADRGHEVEISKRTPETMNRIPGD